MLYKSDKIYPAVFLDLVTFSEGRKSGMMARYSSGEHLSG